MEKKNKTILLFFVSLIIVSFLLTFSSNTGLPKKIALILSKTPLRLISLTFVPFTNLADYSTSLKQNRLLEEENRQLKVSLRQLSELEAENKRLRNLLSFKQETKLSLVVARVIAVDASSLRRSIIIDRGKNHGLEVGNPVISAEGVVGMIVEIGNSVSRIMLINDIDFSMAAKIKRSDAIGILSGFQDGYCRLKYLSLDEDIKVGDEIASSGKNSRFPSGIPIGEVTRVSREQSGLTLFAIVRPRVKLSSLEEVLVITDY